MESSSYSEDLSPAIRVAVLGQYVVGRPPRDSIEPAINHAADALGLSVKTQWLDEADVTPAILDDFDALFIAPGSPLEPFENILNAIGLARQRAVPCLGTCGGLQRMATEFALSVLDYDEVVHAEKTPDAENPLFVGLACQITGVTDQVWISADNAVGQCYGMPPFSPDSAVTETFYCRFGMNPTHVPAFEAANFQVMGRDADWAPRIFVLKQHPFFVGTLFVPQVISSQTAPHPLIKGLLLAAAEKGATVI